MTLVSYARRERDYDSRRSDEQILALPAEISVIHRLCTQRVSPPHGGKPASIPLCDRCTSPALPLHFPAINYRNAGAIRCWPSIPSTVSRGFDEF